MHDADGVCYGQQDVTAAFFGWKMELLTVVRSPRMHGLQLIAVHGFRLIQRWWFRFDP